MPIKQAAKPLKSFFRSLTRIHRHKHLLLTGLIPGNTPTAISPMPRARFLFLFWTFRLLIFHRFQLDKRLAELPCVPFLIYFIHNPHCLAKCFSLFVLLGATWKIFFSSFHHSSEVFLFRRPSVRAVNICNAASASDKDNRSASVGHESQTNRLRSSNVHFSVSRICICVSVRRVCVVRLWPQSPRGPTKTFIILAANPPFVLRICAWTHPHPLGSGS